jgi:hypothetical protein
MAKAKYKITNWSKYNDSLVKRGSLSIWIDANLEKEWTVEEKSGKKGRSVYYSEKAIETALSLKYLFNLPYRQTEGLLASIIELAQLSIDTPDYSTINKRAKGLGTKLNKVQKTKEITHLVIDSTGLKVYGDGEWKVRKHGTSKRRTWKKLHLAINSDTFDIEAFSLTDNNVGDNEMLEELLGSIDKKIKKASLDGAYDTKDNYTSMMKLDIEPTVPPRDNAVIWDDEPDDHPRNQAVKYINEYEEDNEKNKELGKKEWKKYSGYHRRSLAETGMYRFKTIFGGNLSSRTEERQLNEVIIKSNVINKFNSLGMPITIRVS